MAGVLDCLAREPCSRMMHRLFVALQIGLACCAVPPHSPTLPPNCLQVRTGSGLPAGPAGLLGAVEGFSYLSLLAGVVVFGLQAAGL